MPGSDTNAQLNDHIRKLTYDLSAQEKIEALNSIYETDIINDRTVSAVLMSLDDRSDDDSLRKHGVKIMRNMLQNARLPEEKDTLMRHLMLRIFGRYNDETLIGHNELLNMVVRTIEQNLDNMDHLFVTLMQEITKVQQINYRSERLPQQAATFFETDHQEDTLRSKQVFDLLSEEQLLFTLHDETTPLNTLEAQLEALSKRKLDEISLELIIAHLSPPLHHKHSSAKKAVSLALANIQKWVDEFPKAIDAINTQRINIHNWLNNPERHSLDEATHKQLGMNTLLVPELVKLLTEPKKYRNVCEPKQLFTLLGGFNSVRTGNQMKRICAFIDDSRHLNAKSDFPFLEAIDFLESHLTGLDEYQSPSEVPESETNHQKYLKRLLIENNLKADKHIKRTVLSLSLNKALDQKVRARAWSVLIGSMSTDLMEILQEHIQELPSEKKLFESVLHDISGLHSPDTHVILQGLWNNRAEYSSETNQQLAVTIGAMGHYDIVPLLLPAAFDEPDEALREVAAEVLINEGYAQEIEKETHRRKILELHKREKKVTSDLVKNEKQIKELHQTIRQAQSEYNETSQQYWLAVNELDTFGTGKKLELADTGIDLAELKSRIQVLWERLLELQEEIRELTRHLNAKVDAAENLLRMVRTVEADILRKDRELAQMRNDLARARDELIRLRKEEKNSRRRINSLDSDLGSAVRKFNSLESNVRRLSNKISDLDGRIRSTSSQVSSTSSDNRSRINSLNSRLSGLRRERSSIQGQRDQEYGSMSRQQGVVNQLRHDLSSEQSSLNRIEHGIQNTQQNIRHFEATIPKLEADIARLQAQHNELRIRLNQLNRDIDDYRFRVQRHTSRAADLKSEIQACQRQLQETIRLQEAIRRSSESGTSERQSVINDLDSQSKALTESLHQMNLDFAAAEDRIQNLKTEKQTLTQQVEFERSHYDALGDKCNVQSNEANARNEHRSRQVGIKSRGDDEVKLGQDQVVKRSTQVYPDRFANTSKMKDRLKKEQP